MEAVEAGADRAVVLLKASEILAAGESLVEVCLGLWLSESEVETRLGITRREAQEIIDALKEAYRQAKGRAVPTKPRDLTRRGMRIEGLRGGGAVLRLDKTELQVVVRAIVTALGELDGDEFLTRVEVPREQAAALRDQMGALVRRMGSSRTE